MRKRSALPPCGVQLDTDVGTPGIGQDRGCASALKAPQSLSRRSPVVQRMPPSDSGAGREGGVPRKGQEFLRPERRGQ